MNLLKKYFLLKIDTNKGCLAFYNFGLYIIEKLKSASFSDVHGIAIINECYMNYDYAS